MLGTTLVTVDQEGDDIVSVVKNAEANITSWHLYLPESKKEPVQPDGSVDEIMFRAHMLLNTYVNTNATDTHNDMLTSQRHYTSPSAQIKASLQHHGNSMFQICSTPNCQLFRILQRTPHHPSHQGCQSLCRAIYPVRISDYPQSIHNVHGINGCSYTHVCL